MSDVNEDESVVVPIGPELDLHSFLPGDIPSVVADYVEAAARAGIRRVRIVHGRGHGIQRGIVQSVLERHPSVIAFEDDPVSHLGATFADLLL
jgi:DNA-nicking Smr family endonuclease